MHVHCICALQPKCSVCVVCRLLAENQICSAVVQALKHAVETPQEEPVKALPSRLPGDFSIAAIQLHTSTTPTGNGQINNPLDSDLISALLRAAVAFSTSQQLSEQLMAFGVMLPLAMLLNQGSVRDHHTPLVVELLWNLLETCPLSDAHTEDHFAAGNSTLCARHSQIIKPRQKTLNETGLSGEERDGNCGSDAEQESTFGPDDTPTDLFEQQQDDAQADRDYGDATEEEFPQEPQQASVQCPADYSSGCTACTEVAVDTPDTTCDAATEGDAEAAAHSDDQGSSSDFSNGASTIAKSRLSGHSNRQASANSTTSTSPPSADDDNSAVGDRPAIDDRGSDVSSSQAAAAAVVTDDIMGVGVEKEVAAGIVRLLTDCFEHGYSTADKELRNTVLVVSGMLAESQRYRRALCCPEMLQQLTIASTEPELGDCSTACLKVRSTFITCASCSYEVSCCALLGCAVLGRAVLCCAMLSCIHASPLPSSGRSQHSVCMVSLSTHMREIGCMHFICALPDITLTFVEVGVWSVVECLN